MSIKRGKLKDIDILVFVFTRSHHVLTSMYMFSQSIVSAIEIYGKYITRGIGKDFHRCLSLETRVVTGVTLIKELNPICSTECVIVILRILLS